jgi:hypothetical protein
MKFVVTKVTVRQEASTTQYMSKGKAPDDLKELLKGVANMKNWTVQVSGDKVTAAYPTVDGHPGHVDGSDWKMYVERGKKTVDRLRLVRKYTTVPNKKDPNQMNVEIYVSAFTVQDTH